ncbi:MAG: PAS domain-containing protein [Deltaproteobacteria bacterium]|nr:PAS domain-containing protein [Deltaproteobacteria bacterium]
MRPWTPRLVLYFLLPTLVTFPLLVTGGYVLARHALVGIADQVAGTAAVEEARAIGARLPPDLAAAAGQRHCHDEVHGSVVRLTVIAAQGHVLCDTEADPAGMVNHASRPEVLEALAHGAGIARRDSSTLRRPLLYVAVRLGDGAATRIVRIAIPTELVAGAERRLDAIVLCTILATAVLAVVPALYLGQRLARRLARMVAFSRAVASGDLTARLSASRRDELGELEQSLDEMSRQLRMWLTGMQAESDKVRGILGAMIEGVVVISANGKIILMNRRAEEIFGLDPDTDYHGRPLIETCRDHELQELLRETVATGIQVSLREITLADEAKRHLAVSVAPLADRIGFVLVFHDITEIKRLETMRRDFVANVSHELRTPLTAIRGYTETLLSGAIDDPARARSFLGVIDRHSERLSRLIDDLLTLSDLELGKTPVKKEAVLLESLVDEAFEVLGARARRGNVTLVTELPPGLPLVLGDGDRLQQVLINLVDNAVKYTPAGGTVTIGSRVPPHPDTSMIEVSVTDTGLGIPAEEIPRLTERFYRVDKARSRELGGTGLGLAIVKHIVQAHHGKLIITSTPNVGTCVKFIIPRWSAREESS